jgi:hypothetical protein
MLNLTIHHKIYLIKEQRYDLYHGIDVVVTGISIPVWFSKKLIIEPVHEIFCKYHLKNNEKNIPIQINNDGYKITIPNREAFIPNISNEYWRKLNREGIVHQKFYSKFISEVSAKKLLDIQDGGSKSLCYREHNQIKKNLRWINVAHYVNIKDISEFENSSSIIKDNL